MNKVILIGNVGNDVESKDINGSTLSEFSLATNEKWKDKSGKLQEKTEWHRIKMWGKVAEIAQKYVKKGDKLALEGKIETSKYEKNGEDRYSTSINVYAMEMVGQKQSEPTQINPNPQPQNTNDDDIPF